MARASAAPACSTERREHHVGRPAALSRERIVDAAIQLVETGGAASLSARRLGETLGCDASALYRHFANMGEVEREVGDRFLGLVDVRPLRGEEWRGTARRICVDLRKVQLQHPRFAALVSAAPTRLANELRITEALLRELRRSGLPPAEVARGYDAVVMGADKWHQLHELRFYDHDPRARDRALASLPRVAVAPRDGWTVPEQHRLHLPAEFGEVSATAVREGRHEWRARPASD